MIIFVTSAHHKYALDALRHMDGAPDIRILSYNRLFKLSRIPFATYIFTDFDRLNFWELELAAKIFRLLEKADCRVMNDPACVPHRFPLLKRLHKLGHNTFGVWDASVDPLPDRYPIFLRTKAAHRGALSSLLKDDTEAEAALENALAEGFNIHDLMFVEYCAESLEPGLFRKYSAYIVGREVITGMCVHDGSWHAKYGSEGIATADHYQEEYKFVVENVFAEQMLPVFEDACISFGRADFAVVDNRVETYEINTNPYISPIFKHPFAIRLEADKLHYAKLISGLSAIDSPAHSKAAMAKLKLDVPELIQQRRLDRGVFGVRWTP
ncbi:MAG: hypothetical protein AAF950_03550 [Pseudomonadota bacterium]